MWNTPPLYHSVTEEVNLIPCERCSNCFEFQKEIIENMCDICKVKIAEKERIELPNNFLCNVCNRTFKTRTLFIQHKNCQFEDSSISYVCEQCNLMWTKEEPFDQHMKQKHTNHVCVRCNLKVEGKDNLDQHFRSKHRAF